ncbi:MAG: peptidoglycan-binding protein [Moorea sp. SIO2B7]|nr:peptidoglycan-binding protein [Moorena sp. SIO2B7]
MERQPDWKSNINPIPIIFLTSYFLLVTLLPSIAQQSSLPEISRPSLRIGSRGSVVSELQAALKLLGYYDGSVNGIYSESSAIAVSRFQQAAGLEVNGIVNSATWQRLFPSTPPKVATPTSSSNTSTNRPTGRTTANSQSIAALPILKQGMEGNAVRRLQQRLSALGFFKGQVDGIFGQQTLNAVIAAQSSFGLDADGIVGSATWKKLFAQ